ncbi:MAG TPA: hypothetical protein VND44_02355 [Acidimicrobiales bacterium]|nr:hypothetical protein [Acidimicrobiales bacterium]
MKRSRILPAAAAVLIGVALLVAAAPSPAGASTSPTWSIASSANTSPTQDNYLNGVSCTSPTACVAAGVSYDGTHDHTLIETWDGTAWSVTPSPNTSATQTNVLAAVSCTSPSACVAVGDSSDGTNNQTLIETWDGTAWSISPSPDTSPTQDNSLSGVSCTSSTACVAVGDSSDGTQQQALIVTWNGTAWSLTSSPAAPPNQDNILVGVSCTSATACVAAGRTFDGTTNHTLIETWDGTAWSVTPSPNTSATHNDFLNGVSCTSSTACVAVGQSNDGTRNHTLIETWDGTAWSVTPSPNTSSTSDDTLAGVSCTSSTACVAVGQSSDGTTNHTLIETWDGTAWSVTPSPNASSTQANVLAAVSCASPTACVAAGFFSGATNNQTLVASAIAVGGYRLVATDGGIFSFGSAPFYGSMGGTHLNQPVVGMAATPNGAGYWMVASDGGIFSFGAAAFHGSMGGSPLNRPIVGMASTPDGRGYWLVASDGGIFSFGDATFHGSTGALHLNQPIVGMAATADGGGYWLVASDGGIFAFGDATFQGSMGGQSLNKPIVGMAASPLGTGYWMVASDGGIFSFGDATFHGSMGGAHLNKPIVGMAPSPVGGGYWLVATDGGIFNFGSAPYLGSTGAITLNQPVVGMAG